MMQMQRLSRRGRAFLYGDMGSERFREGVPSAQGIDMLPEAGDVLYHGLFHQLFFEPGAGAGKHEDHPVKALDAFQYIALYS